MLRHLWKKTTSRSSEKPPRRSRPRVASVFLGVLLGVLSASTCPYCVADAPDNNIIPVTLNAGFSARMFPAVDLTDVEAALKVWFGGEMRVYGVTLNATVRIYKNDADMRNALEKKEINYGAMLAIDYLRLRNAGLAAKDVTPAVTGNAMDEYVLLVSRDGGIKGLEGLKQKKAIVQAGGLGEVPTIWLDTVLMKRGLSAAPEFCREVKPVPKASGAVLPVFFGQADACVVIKKAFMTMAELNPQLGKRLNVLAESASFPRAVSWFHGVWDKEAVKRCETMIIASTPDPAYRTNSASRRQFLMILGYDNLVVWEPGCLRDLETLLKDYEYLSKKAKEKEDAARGDGAEPERADAPPATVPETSGRTDPQPAKGK